ncbi:MAG: glycoside hydrolase family 172 protein [Promethearchaeota archaeon]
MEMGYHSLANLTRIRKNVKRNRISSYDKTGANIDTSTTNPGKKYEICYIKGAGCIKHLWMTLASEAPNYLREVVLRMWWDDEESPSVEVPIGDFFGVGHGKTVNYWSLPLSMAPQDGKGFNCWFPMPFTKSARIEIENETNKNLVCYYYVDYEEHEKLDDSLGRFHAQWRRENPCKGVNYEKIKGNIIDKFWKKNLTHEDDYVILEAKGEGHYVGCVLNIHNLYMPKSPDFRNWPGEGDDYIEIDDGERILYGTGTEDYFCTSWGPNQYFCSPYYGITLPGGKQYTGKISYYRFHIEDPIYFHKNIKVKIEHGHANQRSDDFSSTAYWYQTEPHNKFPPLLPREQRLPREGPKEIPFD